MGGYDECWLFGEYIKIFFHGTLNGRDRKINLLQISGKGCRDLEKIHKKENIYLKIFEFFCDSRHFGYPKRIDNTIDVFTNKYFNMRKIQLYTDSLSFVSKWKKFSWDIEKDKDGYLTKDSCYFGGIDSNMCINMYDKKIQKKEVDEEIDIHEVHYRIEMRFKEDRAVFFIKNYIRFFDKDFYDKNIKCYYDDNIQVMDRTNLFIDDFKDINEFTFNMLYSLLDFKDLEENITRIERKKTAQWWLDFIGLSSKCKFKYDSKRGATLNKKIKWCEKSVFKCMSMIYLSFKLSNNISFEDWFKKQISNNLQQFENLNFFIIRDYLKKEFGLVLSNEEIKKYIKENNLIEVKK